MMVISHTVLYIYIYASSSNKLEVAAFHMGLHHVVEQQR